MPLFTEDGILKLAVDWVSRPDNRANPAKWGVIDHVTVLYYLVPGRKSNFDEPRAVASPVLGLKLGDQVTLIEPDQERGLMVVAGIRRAIPSVTATNEERTVGAIPDTGSTTCLVRRSDVP
jgi:hypothetical protein